MRLETIFKSRLRLLMLICVASLALVVSACGSDDSSSADGGGDTNGNEGEQVSLGFFGLAAENAYTQAMYEAAESAAKENNASIEFFDGELDGAIQVTQVQDAVTSGRYDGFLIMPNDQSGIVPVVEQAIADGIEVAALQFPIGADPTDPKPQVEGLTTSVIEDVVRGAEVTAEAINEMCVDRDPCETAILWGSREVTWDGPAKTGPLMDALDPNVEIVAEADGGFLQGPGQQATADILQSNPGLDVLATPSGDQMTLGGERAIEAAGKTIGLADRGEDEIAIVGYGAAKSGVQRVRDGAWYNTYALIPRTMAKDGTEMLIDSIRGEEIESDGLVQTEISPVGDNITQQVLKENPDWKAEWEG